MHNSDDDGANGAKKRNYVVGYRKPPSHSRFKPGQSGNPKGRPKGSRSFSAHANEILSESIIMREGDQSRRITKREALLRKAYKDALDGDHRARQFYYMLGLQFDQENRAKSDLPDQAAVSDEDQAIIAAFGLNQSKGRNDNEN
jgi:hypothetical protein